MPLPTNIACPFHSNQQYYISAVCLYTHCEHQPALCLACQKDFHSDHQQFCYTFQEIEEKTKNLDSVMDIKQSFMIFKKEIIDLLNFIGLTIQQSTFSFQSRFLSSEYKQISQQTINELGNALRNTQEQISKRHQIISYFNEFLAEFEKRTKQFTGQIKYQYPKQQQQNVKHIQRDETKTRLVKRNSETISNSRSNNTSKVELSKISRAQSDFSIDNNSKLLQQLDFNKILFRLDFNHIQGEANIINDYSLKSTTGCIALLHPPLNDIINNYIKLSFKIQRCQGLVCIGVATNTQKCSFANLDSKGKVYTSWNFLEHNTLEIVFNVQLYQNVYSISIVFLYHYPTNVFSISFQLCLIRLFIIYLLNDFKYYELFYVVHQNLLMNSYIHVLSIISKLLQWDYVLENMVPKITH